MIADSSEEHSFEPNAKRRVSALFSNFFRSLPVEGCLGSSTPVDSGNVGYT